jgi:diacylglycerol kinase (ATP)
VAGTASAPGLVGIVNIVAIVVTPGSGEGRALGIARRVRRLLRRRGMNARLQAFDDLASLAEWARSTPADFTHLVCVGGDATLSAAAAAAIRCGVPFVPVPTGFGNVFASVLGYLGQAREVARLIQRGEVRLVDVGQAGGQLFLSHRSYGFLERVQEAVEEGRRQPRRRFWRHLAYYGMAGGILVRLPLEGIRVEVDGIAVAEDAVLVTVANVETYHGFLSLTPAASPVDGRLDVFIVPRTTKVGLAWRLLKLVMRWPGCWRGARLYRGRHVAVTTGGRRDELVSRRGALPLLVARGALERLRQRSLEEAPPVLSPLDAGAPDSQATR